MQDVPHNPSILARNPLAEGFHPENVVEPFNERREVTVREGFYHENEVQPFTQFNAGRN